MVTQAIHTAWTAEQKIKSGEEIPAAHKLNGVKAKAATHTSAGNTAYWVCSECGKYFSDADGKNEITKESTVIPQIEHSFSTAYKSDSTNHWHECECGAKSDEAAHSGGTATCIHKAICSVCGAEYGELDPNNHAGKTEVRNAKAATCTENGYTGDTYCMDCGAKN